MAMDFIHVGMSISLIGNIASGFSMPMRRRATSWSIISDLDILIRFPPRCLMASKFLRSS